MAVNNSLSSLLTTLTTSIQSATEALPEDGILPPKDGISLLDVKNDLLLSYLQNLVFLILLKLRSRSSEDKDDEVLDTQDEVVKKLVELRVYLEKGVRPLETRLKYQIDKIIRTADDAARKSTQSSAKSTGFTKKKPKAGANAGSDFSDAESDGSAQTDDDLEDVSYGPNRAAFIRPQKTSEKATESSKDGIYKPPRITPQAMPVTRGKEVKKDRRADQSAIINEFVATELSEAPLAQPNIGSTIVSGGRHVKSEKERRDEAERRDYEENNFTRLPVAGKKDRAKNGGRARDGGWGGEDWRELGAGLDRIDRLTQKKGGRGALGKLENSRKRPISDGPRGTGAEAGEMFEKRRKVVSRYRK